MSLNKAHNTNPIHKSKMHYRDKSSNTYKNKMLIYTPNIYKPPNSFVLMAYKNPIDIIRLISRIKLIIRR